MYCSNRLANRGDIAQDILLISLPSAFYMYMYDIVGIQTCACPIML